MSNSDISILELILNASLLVQFIIGTLVMFSVVSWGIIFNKWITITFTRNEMVKFLHRFRAANNVTQLFNEIVSKKYKSGVIAVFYNGLNEYNKLHKTNITEHEIIIDNIERTIYSTIDEETERQEKYLSVLATFGSVSPYIGLLGTVWGIMHAFLGLGASGVATLTSVAPGIAESLVATAVGLFVAIPAYIFYNKFTADVSSISNKMHKFGDDLLNTINRKLIPLVLK